MGHPSRKTIATKATSPAPLQVLLYTLPIWGASMALALFMPISGTLFSIVMIACLLILPFKARKGLCPACETPKALPFSGFGNRCKGCGGEIVLRNNKFHLLEVRAKGRRPGS